MVGWIKCFNNGFRIGGFLGLWSLLSSFWVSFSTGILKKKLDILEAF
jgi:hypothetical protein